MAHVKGLMAICLLITAAVFSTSAHSAEQEQSQVAQERLASNDCHQVADEVEARAVGTMIRNLESRRRICGVTEAYIETLRNAVETLEEAGCRNPDYEQALKSAGSLECIICRNC